MAENKISVFEDIEALNQSVKKHLQKGDVILIKGSRGMQLERVVCSIKDS
jgi:UDP-N-acetylmuramyl pentapeptide synthase